MPRKKKIAFITGISGQDGSYLAEFLVSKGYEVHGLARPIAPAHPELRFSHIAHLISERKAAIHYGDITDYSTLWRIIGRLKPDEIYHLAAQSQIGISFDDDLGEFATNVSGTHYLLSAIKELKPNCRFFFAASSEMFGKPKIAPQNENTPVNPISPYGITKTTSYHLVRMYRDTHGVFGCSDILFNHESPRRGTDFVTRKISLGAAKIKLGLAKELSLGSLEARRDWGFAGDYVEAMWMMLERDTPDDYVIGTGKNHSILEFVETAFGLLDLDWKK